VTQNDTDTSEGTGRSLSVEVQGRRNKPAYGLSTSTLLSTFPKGHMGLQNNS